MASAYHGSLNDSSASEYPRYPDSAVNSAIMMSRMLLDGCMLIRYPLPRISFGAAFRRFYLSDEPAFAPLRVQCMTFPCPYDDLWYPAGPFAALSPSACVYVSHSSLVALQRAMAGLLSE